MTNCSPACSAGISGVHLVLLFLYVLLHVSPVWYYLLQTASYLGAASTVFYNKPGRALNEPITRAAGRRGFCEPLSACPLLSLGGGMKLLRGELKWAFAGRSTLNRTGMVHLERQSGSEGTKRTREHLSGGLPWQPPKAPKWVHSRIRQLKILHFLWHKLGWIKSPTLISSCMEENTV